MKFNLDSIKKQPQYALLATAIVAGGITYGVTYRMVIESIREQKDGLYVELQMTKQRLSSVEATNAAHEALCTSKLQAQSKESQDRCDKQLTAAIDTSRQLVLTNEKLIEDGKRKDQALVSTTAQLNGQQNAASQLKQLRIDENLIAKRLEALHADHKKVSRNYGINKIECEKKSEYSFGNICEHASMGKAQLDSIALEIESSKLRLAQKQQQIVQLQSR